MEKELTVKDVIETRVSLYEWTKMATIDKRVEIYNTPMNVSIEVNVVSGAWEMSYRIPGTGLFIQSGHLSSFDDDHFFLRHYNQMTRTILAVNHGMD